MQEQTEPIYLKHLVAIATALLTSGCKPDEVADKAHDILLDLIFDAKSLADFKSEEGRNDLN